MRKSLPIIHESPADLKHRYLREQRPARRQRLHLLYLLASGHARYRTEVAAMLGVDRNTVAHWLDTYQHGGLDALLTIYIPAGKTPALTAPQRDQLYQRLQHPDGFASYDAIRQWITTTFAVEMSYNAVYKLVHDKWNAKPKVARPTHEKKILPL